MNRRKLSHVIAAGLLAGLLGFPGAALAQPVHRGVTADLWSWLAGFWSRGVTGLRVPSGMEQKAGPGIDPNGGNPPSSGGATVQGTPTGSPTSGSTSHRDAGPGIDPNG